MLPNLYNLQISQCLPPDINDAREKVPNAKLRGPDAVFWPANRSREELIVLASVAYPHENFVDYKKDAYVASLNDAMVHENVHKTTIRAREHDQLLYHWTNAFPSIPLKTGDTVKTHGYVWTSTSKLFVWDAYERVTIVLPKDAVVDVYVDPGSHSRYYTCEENVSQTHKDVVLPPSVFEVQSVDGSDEDRRRVAWSVLNNFVNRDGASTMSLRLESVNDDPTVWLIVISRDDMQSSTVKERLSLIHI